MFIQSLTEVSWGLGGGGGGGKGVDYGRIWKGEYGNRPL